MKIEDDGNLSLHYCDIAEEYKEELKWGDYSNYPNPFPRSFFNYESKVAVWYAVQCKAVVKFVAPGIILRVV